MTTYFTTLLIALLLTVPVKSQPTLYLLTDKTMYFPGETIWFKAHSRSTASNLYIGLYNTNGQQLAQKKYPLLMGSANGDFVLPDTLNTPCLMLYARLADSSTAQQKIMIAGSRQTLPVVTGTTRLTIHPEGGQLVAGVSNYIALRATLPGGLPFTTTGSIKAEGIEPISFSTNENGLAYIEIIPQAGTNYYAQWQDVTAQTVQKSLPLVQTTGIALHTEQTTNKLHYRIQSTGNNSNSYLTIQQADHLIYQSALTFSDAVPIVNHITTDSLQNGPVYIMVTNKEGTRLAQSVVIINNSTNNTIKLINYKTNWQPKAQQVITIALPDAGNYAASITDINFTSNQNISSHWLPQQADIAALTQYWPQTVSTDAGQYLNIDFTGKGKSFSSKEALSIIVKDRVGTQQYGNLPAQANRFYQPGYIFYDTAKVYYQLVKDKERVDELKIETSNNDLLPVQIPPIVSEVISENITQPIPVKDSIIKNFTAPQRKQFNVEQTLTEVRVKARRVNPETKRLLEIEDTYVTGMFKGLARGFSLNVLDDPQAEAAGDIFNYIAFRIPGLLIRYDTREGKILSSTRGTPLIFINETESPNEMLQTISITQLAYVKYVPGIVIGASFRTNAGALYIYTKNGKEPLPPSKNMRITKLKGYDIAQNFTQPDYENKANRQIPDQRSSLYWNPYLQADEGSNDNQCTIKFYNNDISKKLLLTIQGVDAESRPVYWQQVLE